MMPMHDRKSVLPTSSTDPLNLVQSILIVLLEFIPEIDIWCRDDAAKQKLLAFHRLLPAWLVGHGEQLPEESLLCSDLVETELKTCLVVSPICPSLSCLSRILTLKSVV